MTTPAARASKRWITLGAYFAMWLLVGPVLCQWDVFTSMVIPMISLGGAYIIGDTWRPSFPEAPAARPQPAPPTTGGYPVGSCSDEG